MTKYERVQQRYKKYGPPKPCTKKEIVGITAVVIFAIILITAIGMINQNSVNEALASRAANSSDSTDYLLSRIYEKASETGEPLDELAAPYSFCTVSNLSSSRALRDVTEKYGGEYFSAAVGEVNVTARMKETGALIGGEGNGGVIYPALHYGRDAMVGIALFLTNLAYRKCKATELLKTYPQYTIAKNKIQLSDKSLIDKILNKMKEIYASEDINDIDGVKISFEAERKWVHLRKSNTEPIIRIYAEAPDAQQAEKLAEDIIAIAEDIIKK